MKIAVAQLTSSDDPDANLDMVLSMMDQAKGVDMLFTPEVTNCVSMDRAHQMAVLQPQEGNSFLDAVRAKAHALGLWVHLGSIAVKTDDPQGRFANRSVLIDPLGEIRASYDKIHMFDVRLSETEQYRESAGYRAGEQAVVVNTPHASLGMTVCYDLRFPKLYRDLAQSGAQILTVPAAFAVPTGQAHWATLLRARAIETGCFVVASAQTGKHRGSGRRTYGHSMIIDPWGEVVLDAGRETGLHFAQLDLTAIDKARRRVPSLDHDKPYSLVKINADEHTH